jgi:hypothetical protein
VATDPAQFPPTKEHIPMRATLTTVSAVALLAAGAGSAAARPADKPLHLSDAARHAQAIRTQPVNYRHLGGDRPTVASPAQPAPAPIVRVTRAPLADGGFDWADAGIGAGLAAALLLGAAGVSGIRRPPSTTAR